MHIRLCLETHLQLLCMESFHHSALTVSLFDHTNSRTLKRVCTGSSLLLPTNVHLFALECSPPQPQIEQGNGRFRFFARHSKFSKGALRAVGAVAWAAASGGTKSCAPRRCTAKLLVTVRCAVQAFFICCGCGSSAASSRAVQLEQPKASKRERESKKAEEAKASQEAADRCRMLSLRISALPPPLFVISDKFIV